MEPKCLQNGSPEGSGRPLGTGRAPGIPRRGFWYDLGGQVGSPKIDFFGPEPPKNYSTEEPHMSFQICGKYPLLSDDAAIELLVALSGARKSSQSRDPGGRRLGSSGNRALRAVRMIPPPLLSALSGARKSSQSRDPRGRRLGSTEIAEIRGGGDDSPAYCWPSLEH